MGCQSSKGGDISDEKDKLLTMKNKRKDSVLVHHRGSIEEIELSEHDIKKELSRQEIIENHKNKAEKLDEFHQKTRKLNQVMYNLQEDYDKIKGNWCLFCNLEPLVNMVEDAVDSYKSTIKLDDVMPEPSSNVLSPITRLLEDSRRLSIMRHSTVEAVKIYRNMTNEEIIKDMVRLGSDLMKAEQEFDNLSRKLATLETEFKKIDETCLFFRGGVMKKIIEIATIDCPRDQ